MEKRVKREIELDNIHIFILMDDHDCNICN